MKTELIQTLTSTFESHAKQTESGVNFWLARDLQQLLGYGKWDNFKSVISKAKTACELSGGKKSSTAERFWLLTKEVSLGQPLL